MQLSRLMSEICPFGILKMTVLGSSRCANVRESRPSEINLFKAAR